MVTLVECAVRLTVVCVCNRIIENKATTCSRCDTQPVGIFSGGADGAASFRLKPGLVASELNTVTLSQKHTHTFTNTHSEAYMHIQKQREI